MLERREFNKAISERPLLLREILQQAFALLNERFGAFILLMIAVYLPVQLLTQYTLLQIDLSGENLEELWNQLLGIYKGEIGLSFLEMAAVLVTAVMVHNQIFDEERLAFGTAFYRGLRMWLRAAFTVMLLMLLLFSTGMAAGLLLMMPGMLLLAFPLILLGAVMYNLLHGFICNAAALRGRFGFDGFRYVAFVLKGRMGKAIGNYAVILLLTGGALMVCNYMLSSITAQITIPLLSFAIQVIFSVLLSVWNIYGYIALSILFLNLEELKRGKTAAD